MRNTKNILPLLTIEERLLVVENQRTQSESRIKEKIQQFRSLKGKYRDLVEREKQRMKDVPNFSLGAKNGLNPARQKLEFFSEALRHYQEKLRDRQKKPAPYAARTRTFRSPNLSPK